MDDWDGSYVARQMMWNDFAASIELNGWAQSSQQSGWVSTEALHNYQLYDESARQLDSPRRRPEVMLQYYNWEHVVPVFVDKDAWVVLTMNTRGIHGKSWDEKNGLGIQTSL